MVHLQDRKFCFARVVALQFQDQSPRSSRSVLDRTPSITLTKPLGISGEALTPGLEPSTTPVPQNRSPHRVFAPDRIYLFNSNAVAVWSGSFAHALVGGDEGEGDPEGVPPGARCTTGQPASWKLSDGSPLMIGRRGQPARQHGPEACEQAAAGEDALWRQDRSLDLGPCPLACIASACEPERLLSIRRRLPGDSLRPSAELEEKCG